VLVPASQLERNEKREDGGNVREVNIRRGCMVEKEG
jgi:hypothetical protein